jgi:hypothetical protein
VTWQEVAWKIIFIQNKAGKHFCVLQTGRPLHTPIHTQSKLHATQPSTGTWTERLLVVCVLLLASPELPEVELPAFPRQPIGIT